MLFAPSYSKTHTLRTIDWPILDQTATSILKIHVNHTRLMTRINLRLVAKQPRTIDQLQPSPPPSLPPDQQGITHPRRDSACLGLQALLGARARRRLSPMDTVFAQCMISMTPAPSPSNCTRKTFLAQLSKTETPASSESRPPHLPLTHAESTHKQLRRARKLGSSEASGSRPARRLEEAGLPYIRKGLWGGLAGCYTNLILINLRRSHCPTKSRFGCILCGGGGLRVRCETRPCTAPVCPLPAESALALPEVSGEAGQVCF